MDGVGLRQLGDGRFDTENHRIISMDDDLRQRIFERVRDTLKKLDQRAEELKGKRSIPATELFSPSFMNENTSFESFDAFLDAGGFEVGEEENVEAVVSEDALDRLVQDETPYDSWEAMKEDAVTAWAWDYLKGDTD